MAPMRCLVVMALIVFCSLARADDKAWRDIESALDYDPDAMVHQAEQDLRRASRTGDKAAELKALRLLTLAHHQVDGEPYDGAKVERAITLARELGDAESLAWMLYEKAWIEFQANNHAAASDRLLDESAAIATQLHWQRMLAWIEYRHGATLLYRDANTEGMTHFSNAYALFDSERDRYGMAASLTGLGLAMADVDKGADNQKQAIAYHLRALGMLDPEVNRISAEESYVLLGVSYYRAKDYANYAAALNKALAIAEKRHGERRIGEIEYRLGLGDQALKHFPEALAHVERAVPLLARRANGKLYLAACALRADVLAALGRRKESLDALAVAKAALPGLDLDAETVYHKRAANVYTVFGDYRNAFEEMKAWRDTDNRRANANNKKQMDELQVRFDVRLREQENAALKARQSALVLALVLSVVILGGGIYFLKRRAAAARVHAQYL
jgi:tetratricopeptide (TPR) repeat protein